MRPIKFRAWYRGAMYRFVEHHSYPDGSSDVNCIGESIERMFSPGDEVELMQFTGLVDKHGKEVYEGDIYRNLDNGLIGKFYYLNGPGGYTLYCREQTRDGSPYNMLPFALLDTTNFEVLGNIYENADLLGVQP